MIYFATGVALPAAEGHGFVWPDEGEHAPWACRFQARTAEKGIEVLSIQYCLHTLADAEFDALEHHRKSMLTFRDWMNAEIVRAGYLDNDGVLQLRILTRANLIRRAAVCGGSHPVFAVSLDNDNDAAIAWLDQFFVGKVSVPYMLILKIAQDILEHLPPLIDDEA